MAKAKTARNAEICRRVSQGETLTAVSKDFGITCERVRQICKEAGVYSKSKHRDAAEMRVRVRRMWEDKRTSKEMAAALGVSLSLITVRLRELGLKAHRRCKICDTMLPEDVNFRQWYCESCRTNQIRMQSRRSARAHYQQHKDDPDYKAKLYAGHQDWRARLASGDRPMPAENCEHCDAPIPRTAHPNRRFCKIACRYAAAQERARKRKANLNGGHHG